MTSITLQCVRLKPIASSHVSGHAVVFEFRDPMTLSGKASFRFGWGAEQTIGETVTELRRLADSMAIYARVAKRKDLEGDNGPPLNV